MAEQSTVIQRLDEALQAIDRQRQYAAQQLDDPEGHMAYKCLDNIALHTQTAIGCLNELQIPDKTVTEHCLNAHTIVISLIQEVIVHYRMSPRAAVIEEMDSSTPEATHEFVLFCKDCGVESSFHPRSDVPLWAQKLYDRVYRIHDGEGD